MRHLPWAVLCIALVGGCDVSSEIRVHDSGKGDHAALRVVEALQCPRTEGILTRKGSAAGDGRSCTYAGPRGTEVSLTLASLEGTTTQDLLRDVEAQLSSDLPEAVSALSRNGARGDQPEIHGAVNDTADRGRVHMPGIQIEDNGERSSIRLPGMQVDNDGERSSVRLPGMRIESDGGRSVVRIGGIVIHSDDRDQSSSITIPSGEEGNETVTVNANPDAAVVRALAPGQSVRASYRLALNRQQNASWRVVGYEARGPAGGPIVIATVRSREDNDDRVFDAAKTLVTMNVGN